MSVSAHADDMWSTGSLSLLAGSTVIVLTEAIAGTVLGLARLDIMGDTHSSIDEFAKLDYGYTGMKLLAFVLTPWIAGRFGLFNSVLAAAALMTFACGAAAYTTDLDLVFALRLIQGFSGGVIVVGTQALLFRGFPIKVQPLVQAVFAMGAVAAPATVAPYMQGWLLDATSWSWIFLSIVPIGLLGLTLLALSPDVHEVRGQEVSFDLIGSSLCAVAALSIAYVLSQGNRWDWLNEPTIAYLSLIGILAVVLLIARQLLSRPTTKVLNFQIFRNGGFAFGIVASLAAGFALLGSSYLIPAFAVSVLKMTPTAAGMLLLPSTLALVATLLFTAFLVQHLKLPGIVTVPFGILSFMIAMWMLSASSSASGIPDMLPAIMLRGLALGLLFLSITLLSLSTLSSSLMLYGIGLFNVGRQIGGLVGIAFLQTFIEDQTIANRTVLAAHILPGRTEVASTIGNLANRFMAHGIEAGAARRAAVGVIAKQVTLESTTIAFNTAFLSISLFFLGVAPCIVIWKIVLGKLLARQSPQA